jgi:hypothetical protein
MYNNSINLTRNNAVDFVIGGCLRRLCKSLDKRMEESMENKDYPDHRIETIKLSEEHEEHNDRPEIYAAANYESDYRITRRDFLRESAVLAGENKDIRGRS